MRVDAIMKVCDMIMNSRNTLVLTGAGISTESGIPDFRSPGTGLWEKINPMNALSKTVLFKNPQRFYKEGYKLLISMTNAKPNKGHYALVEMESMGLIQGIITQNIDNLHQKAGSKAVYEVHGNTRIGRCLSCCNHVNLHEITNQVEKGTIPPRCDECGGVLRPDVVMFGDQLPESFNIAWKLVEKCELLIVVGSSLSVAPVNYLPQIAPRVIIINLDTTPFDRNVDIVIRANAGITLVRILEELKRRVEDECI